MATIRFNKFAFRVQMGAYFQQGWFVSSGSSNSALTISGGIAGSALLIIYKGTPETFPTFTDRATRSSDVLITFSLPWGNNSWIDQENAVATHWRVLCGRCLDSTAASASGLATWFLMCRAGTTTLADKAAVLGTVGLSGSGADLEIAQTTITAGNYYRSNGFYVNLPLNYTF